MNPTSVSTLHAMPLIIAALCVLTIAYRFYSRFIAYRVMALDDSRQTPAHRLNDKQNYHPTNKWVLFGHHFAAISGAGPLIGPVLAVQFGWAPTYLWLLVGVVIGGAVQDFVVLTASIRRNGRSLAEIARQELGSFGGMVTAVAILFIVIIALAGLGAAVVNALAESSWGSFTIACSIPIALLMGVYMHMFRHGKPTAILEASAIGLVLLLAAVWGGQFAQTQEWGKHFLLNKKQIVYAMAIYGFIASVLPVWLLLCPRDYLSSFMKIGTIGLLVIGVIIVNPVIHMAPVTKYAYQLKNPVVDGGWFPMVFLTVMCGAVSGFHALVASGTTPKMISQETHARPIGYGAMLIECLVGIVALIAVAALEPNDYFLMNTPKAKVLQQKYDFKAVHLHHIEDSVGEHLEGRTGGAPTLAVGIANIFSRTPMLSGDKAMALWYHFAIMFEALFILTTIDTGTRIARFLLQEFLSKFRFLGGIARKFDNPSWWPGVIFSSGIVVFAWAWMLLNGTIDTIWPMFGIANQMLAAIALAVVTTLLIRAGRAKYCWVTMVPMLWVLFTTTYGGIYQIYIKFLPMIQSKTSTPAQRTTGYVDIVLIIVMITCALVIVGQCARRWSAASRLKPAMSVPGVLEGT
ncbi:MAG: carbon starvation CstA family protein [Candidatus Sumerlaeaceae bacterium]